MNIEQYMPVGLRQSLVQIESDLTQANLRGYPLSRLIQTRHALLDLEVSIGESDCTGTELNMFDLLDQLYDMMALVDHEFELRRLEACYE